MIKRWTFIFLIFKFSNEGIADWGGCRHEGQQDAHYADGILHRMGIFILIVLISSGRGLINGMHHNFKAFNIGIVTVTPRQTSQAFNGHVAGRTIRLYEEDAAALDEQFGDTVVRAIPVVSHAVLANRGKEYANTVVDGFIFKLPLQKKYKYIEYIWNIILPKVRLTTKTELIIVKQILQERICSLLISLQ